MRRRPQAVQLLGSVLAAVAVAAVAVIAVTAHFGPTSSAKLEAREDIVKERLKGREDILEQREKAREERFTE